MSENIRKFLEKNRSRPASEFNAEFISLLQNSNKSATEISKITRSVFQLASESVSDQDKQILSWAEALINSIQSTCLKPKPKVQGTLFFPNPDSETRLIHYLDLAKATMLVCVFTITNNNLRDALIRAHRRNVKVKIISDDECMKQQGSDIQYLRDSGIPTETDTNPEAHMHNKFVVIDSEVLITGSFNWTVAAVNSNQENLVVLQDADICHEYIEYFEGLWRNFRPVEVQEEKAALKIQSNYRGWKDRKNNH